MSTPCRSLMSALNLPSTNACRNMRVDWAYWRAIISNHAPIWEYLSPDSGCSIGRGTTSKNSARMDQRESLSLDGDSKIFRSRIPANRSNARSAAASSTLASITSPWGRLICTCSTPTSIRIGCATANSRRGCIAVTPIYGFVSRYCSVWARYTRPRQWELSRPYGISTRVMPPSVVWSVSPALWRRASIATPPSSV